MATSSGLPEEQQNQLMGKSERSALDRLRETGFEPISGEPGNLAADEVKQREIISAELGKTDCN